MSEFWWEQDMGEQSEIDWDALDREAKAGHRIDDAIVAEIVLEEIVLLQDQRPGVGPESTDMVAVRRAVYSGQKADISVVNFIFRVFADHCADYDTPGWRGLVLAACSVIERDQLAPPVVQVEEVVRESGLIREDPDGDISVGPLTYRQVVKVFPGFVPRMKPCDNRVVDDYFAMLRDRSVHYPSGSTPYSDPYGMMKWEKRTRGLAQSILDQLRGRRVYIPGDGVGIVSDEARKRKIDYVSSEPGGCGTLAHQIGLITYIEPFSLSRDDGRTVLLLMNVPISKVDWQGPAVIWQQYPQVDHYSHVRGYYGCLQVNKIDIALPTVVPRMTPGLSKKLHRIQTERRINVFSTSDKLIYNFMVHHGYVVKWYDDLVEADRTISLGSSCYEFDPFRLQDFKKANRDLVFFCNVGDLLYETDSGTVVHEYGRQVFVRDDSFKVVDICRRERYKRKLIVSDDGFFIRALYRPSALLNLMYQGRRALFRMAGDQDDRDLDAGYYRLQFINFVTVPKEHCKYGMVK